MILIELAFLFASRIIFRSEARFPFPLLEVERDSSFSSLFVKKCCTTPLSLLACYKNVSCCFSRYLRAIHVSVSPGILLQPVMALQMAPLHSKTTWNPETYQKGEDKIHRASIPQGRFTPEERNKTELL